jgi:putative membrane protein
MTIKNFTEHAANERTFLAWIRTALAIMAFGFLLERFDLFLETVGPSLSGGVLSPLGHKLGNIAGLALITAGTAMVALAMIRFIKDAKAIDSDEETKLTRSKLDVALASLLVLLGASMFLFLSHANAPILARKVTNGGVPVAEQTPESYTTTVEPNRQPLRLRAKGIR